MCVRAAIEVRERRGARAAEHRRRASTPWSLKPARVPADRVASLVDVLDEVAFIVARSGLDPRARQSCARCRRS